MRSKRECPSVLISVAVVLLVFSAASGASQFRPAAKYQIGGSGYSVALGDLNGDGVLDIALTTQSPDYKVWVLLGNGDGTFQAGKSYVGSDVALIRGLAIGDFNRDGKLDLAVASSDSDAFVVNILAGNGDGTFQPPVWYPAGPFPLAVVVGDFNVDGNPDVAVMSSDGGSAKGGLGVLLGKGDGTFQPYTFYSGGVNPNSVVTAHFRSDQVLDLATGTTGSVVPVLLGNSDGTFQKTIRDHLGVNPHYVGTGDFNNDGKTDLITTLENTTTGQNKVAIALGKGDGTFQAPITIPSPNPQATAVADFNLDGVDDIAIGIVKAPLDGIYVLLGQGNASFVHEGTYPTGTLVPTAIAVGDLNRDGYPDLVILDGSDSVGVLLNSGGSI